MEPGARPHLLDYWGGPVAPPASPPRFLLHCKMFNGGLLPVLQVDIGSLARAWYTQDCMQLIYVPCYSG